VTFYLGSPGSQMHADWCQGMPVLISFAIYQQWQDDYIQTYDRVLIDSGAYSVWNSGKVIDGAEFLDWQQRWADCVHIDAIAGLDDIRGDWRKSLKNYELYGGFPTYHESDPPELLKELISMAYERGRWLGVGLLKPREGKWAWINETMKQIPDGLHVHVWGGGAYAGHLRTDSVDSTNWFREAWKYKKSLPFLTPAECIELMIKRYQRARRKPAKTAATTNLFSETI